MSIKYSVATKQNLIERYQNGESIATICKESGIPQSTIYSWVKSYHTTITETDSVVTPREFDSLKRKVEKLENIITVLKTVNCTSSAELRDKMNKLEKLHGQFSGHVLCEALDVSRGTYYNHIKRNKRNNSLHMKRREDLCVLIREVYDESRQLYGANKIGAILKEQGHTVSDKMVAELMREMGIYSIRTTAKRDHKRLTQFEKKTNILKQNFTTDSPNQIWVSDVTCFKLKDKYYYICVIIDIYSRKAISYKISLRNSTQLVTSTFRRAYAQRNPSGSLVFHSDRGTPYASYAFQKLLCDHNVAQSFSNSGKPHDNAVSEAFFSSMKQEEIYRTSYRSEAEFKQGIDKYITFYNTKRPHAAIKYKTPSRMEDNN